jgi:hypothetical protein
VLEKLIVAKLVKKFLAFSKLKVHYRIEKGHYETAKFNANPHNIFF